MARGVDGREVFVDEHDRREFLRTILAVKSETSYSILAYCLMGNHFHFAIKVENAPLSRIMQRILTAYVIGFNTRHAREGHLFQARYKSVLCLDDAYLITLIRYIHMNPVRAGLAARPGEWPWSSHRHYAERTAGPLADTRLFFDAFNTSKPGVRDYDLWLGSADESFKPWPEEGSVSPLHRDEPMDAETIDVIASDLFPDDFAALRSQSRQRAVAKKRRMLAERALRNGHSLAAIAAWIGCTPPAVHHMLQRNK